MNNIPLKEASTNTINNIILQHAGDKFSNITTHIQHDNNQNNTDLSWSNFFYDILPIFGNLINSVITISIGVGVHLLSLAIHKWTIEHFNYDISTSSTAVNSAATLIAGTVTGAVAGNVATQAQQLIGDVTRSGETQANDI